MNDELRMSAYYYGFKPTGVREIDLILSAIACAGKSYHLTEDWNDDTNGPDYLVGRTPVEWIQNAAVDAAREIEAMREKIPAPPPDDFPNSPAR